MKKLIGVFLMTFVFVLIFSFKVNAADNASVTATVSVTNVAVSIAPGTVTYGVIDLNTTEDTDALAQTQTVTNDSNVAVDMDIKGNNSAAWTLAGTNGANQYVHKRCITTCSNPVNYTALTTSYGTLSDGVAVSGTVNLDLEITTPTSSASFTPQSVNVDILVTQAP